MNSNHPMLNKPASLSVSILASLLLSSCLGDESSQGAATGTNSTTQPAAADTTKVRFVGFGDAGQATGAGPAAQTAVGNAMASVCKEMGCDFALEFGDNFYLSGVSSTTDTQWQSKFENPYANLNLPVFATLGNHDNSQGPGEGSDNSKGDVQVAYHTASENQNKKWNMPARYYKFTAPLSSANNNGFNINVPMGYELAQTPKEPIVEFFSLDSNPLTAIGLATNDAATYNYITYGPVMMDWYNEALKSSKAPWKIAFAHHPYVSNGLHGNAGEYDGTGAVTTVFGPMKQVLSQLPLPINTVLSLTQTGEPWLDFHNNSSCTNGLDFFMFGHDHDIEWLKPQDKCGPKTNFILSGAAEQPRAFGDPNRNPVYFQKDNILGFWWFEFSNNEMIGTAYEVTFPTGGDGSDFTVTKLHEQTMKREGQREITVTFPTN